MDHKTLEALKRSYDAVADEYVARIYDELSHKPIDCTILDRFAERVGTLGPICDVGCGPGQVARYLFDRGAKVCGVDVSPAMIDAARRLNPDISFEVGDMLSLDVPDEVFGGVAAFYSLVHIPRDEIVQALSELRRTLRPGGLLLVAFHIGEEIIHLCDWWGHAVALDFYFFRSREMADSLRASGLEPIEVCERPPYPDVEHQSHRAYLLSRKT